MADSTSSVPALDRSLDLLELLSTQPAGMTLSELSKALDAPKNAIFRITQTLLARGYLARDADTLAFRLTSRWLKLAPSSAGAVSLPEVSRGAMESLREQTGQTVQLGVLSGREGVIIDQVEGVEALRIVVNLGLRFALYNNAPGKLLLAHLPDAERAEAIATMALDRCTAQTITDRTELENECQRIVKQGYSTDYAEADEGIHCIAAPIFGIEGQAVGTLWVTGPAKRLPKSQFRKTGELAKAAGEQITETILRLS